MLIDADTKGLEPHCLELRHDSGCDTAALIYTRDGG